jgi:hypothetical protein
MLARAYKDLIEEWTILSRECEKEKIILKM